MLTCKSSRADPQHSLKYLLPYLQHDEDVVHHDFVNSLFIKCAILSITVIIASAN
jgi:hypothetical protein